MLNFRNGIFNFEFSAWEDQGFTCTKRMWNSLVEWDLGILDSGIKIVLAIVGIVEH